MSKAEHTEVPRPDQVKHRTAAIGPSARVSRALGMPLGAAAGRKREKKTALTTPDLVLLSLLLERPMHGYAANLELERRCIRDWADISRPHIYYSLEKLARGGWIRSVASEEPAAAPERSAFETTEKGREALADALERKEWATQRERPPFLTWMALSWQARPGVFRMQLQRRREFLLEELDREKKTQLAIYAEVGHRYHEALWMVGLMIDQLRTEIRWTKKLERNLPQRAKALFSPRGFPEGKSRARRPAPRQIVPEGKRRA